MSHIPNPSTKTNKYHHGALRDFAQASPPDHKMTLQDRPQPDLGDIGFPTFHKDIFPRNGYQHASKPVVHVYANRTREGTNHRPGKGPAISMGIENLARIVRVATGQRDGHTPQNPQLQIGWGYSITQSPLRLNKSRNLSTTNPARKDEHTPRNGPPSVPISTDGQETRGDDLMKTRSSFAIARNRARKPCDSTPKLELNEDKLVKMFVSVKLKLMAKSTQDEGCVVIVSTTVIRKHELPSQGYPPRADQSNDIMPPFSQVELPRERSPQLADRTAVRSAGIKGSCHACKTGPEQKYEPKGVSRTIRLMMSPGIHSWVSVSIQGPVILVEIVDTRTPTTHRLVDLTRISEPKWIQRSSQPEHSIATASASVTRRNAYMTRNSPSNLNLVMNEEEERNHLWESYFHYKMALQSCPQFDPGHTKLSRTYEDVQELTRPRTRAKVLKSPLTLMRETGRPGAAILTNETLEPGHDVIEPRKPNTIDERVTRTEFGSYGVAQAPTQVNLFQGPNAHEARPKQRAGLGSSLELIVRTTLNLPVIRLKIHNRTKLQGFHTT
ncbi:hypothetical protein BS47DRAFT_1368526 [Hydnum rufescens UP504]|uniref:Uncharacterized protein n=1 Tax=Hydnum rufescens UP504 TaxID=1448309 RepID=A0A9P6DHL2_9AGAM|nr:hypothetical protein BS47DRAFT_1368526 [Hydnum rufescens UP504]